MKTIIQKLAELEKMSVSELRTLWLELFKNPSPKTAHRSYMIRRLIYRIQELQHGGKDSVLEARLQTKANELFGRRAPIKPLPGSVLTKEYHGVEHQVAVHTDGYEYEGRKFSSLSAVARYITGMSWSGPVFFGLKERA